MPVAVAARKVLEAAKPCPGFRSYSTKTHAPGVRTLLSSAAAPAPGP
ncbi:hypothetical protein OAK19_00345 [Aureispira]|nr:hypothetical protein [Aureispira sp.]